MKEQNQYKQIEFTDLGEQPTPCGFSIGGKSNRNIIADNATNLERVSIHLDTKKVLWLALQPIMPKNLVARLVWRCRCWVQYQYSTLCKLIK